MRESKSFCKISIVLIWASLSISCSEGVPVFERLTALWPIEFSGTPSKTAVITALGSAITIQGQCDKNTKSVILSLDEGKTWTDSTTAMPSRVELTCSVDKRIKFSILTDNSGVLTFTPGTPSQHRIKLIAKDGRYSATESEILVKYQPLAKPPLSGGLINSGGGIVLNNGGKYKLHFRTNGTSASRSKGSVYRVHSTQ